MTTLLYYLLKVVLCSGVLFLYYHLALKNKLFHQWNRFYLLSAVALSLFLPLVHLNVSDHDNGIIYAVESADDYLHAVTVSAAPRETSVEEWSMYVYTLVSLAMLAGFVLALHKIRKLVKTHRVQNFEHINFVNTNEPGTPFSFLRYIFWNENISVTSETGKQIFQHELVHVQEKHTFDKLFLQVVLVFFWCNPFFWLIRRELRFVHEFIADRKAVGHHGTAAFSAMLLHAAFPQHYSRLTNAFFQTSIKRRFLMLSKLSNPKVAYAGRIVALPVTALLVFAFTVRTEQTTTGQQALVQTSKTVYDTVPKKQIASVDVNGQKKQLTITYRDGSSEKLTEKEAMERGLINNEYGNRKQIAAPAGRTGEIRLRDTAAKPMLVVDGIETPFDLLSKLDPNKIQAINVLKGETANGKYGVKGKNGVIEVTTKKTAPGDVITFGADSVTVHNGEKSNNEPIFQEAETEASVNPSSWRSFLEKNTQPVIEDMAKQGAAPGTYTVYVRFVVEKDGSLSDVKVVRNPGYGLDRKLVEVMQNSPRWKPAVQNGRTVRSYHTQPITFVITEVKPRTTS